MVQLKQPKEREQRCHVPSALSCVLSSRPAPPDADQDRVTFLDVNLPTERHVQEADDDINVGSAFEKGPGPTNELWSSRYQR